MSLTHAARIVSATGYGYISSWALLTAAEQRLFDRLPASADDFSDTYPDPHLVETWLHVLADADLVEHHNDGDHAAVWSLQHAAFVVGARS